MRKLLFVSIFVALGVGSLRAQTAKWELMSKDTASLLATNGKVVVAIINNRVFRTTDDGGNWSQTNGSVGSSQPFSFALRDSTWFATTPELYFTDAIVLNKSTDLGINWDSCGILPYGMEVLANKVGLIFAGSLFGDGLYRSMGDGIGWQVLDSDVFINNLEIARWAVLNDSLVVALIDSGISPRLIVSTDFGITWSRGILIDSGNNSVAVSGRAILMGTLTGVHRSFDLGITWTLVSGFEDADIVTKDSIAIAASANGGIILSTDYGVRWQAFNDGLPSLDISALAIGSGEIYAALTSGGIFHSTLPAFSGVTSSQSTAHQSKFEIYPNPLASSASIHYSVTQNCAITISIFDPLGREVMQPISGEWQDAGEHETPIDVRNLVSGIYECRLVAGDNASSIKIVVEH
jgi:hypothetical protein